MNSTIVMPVLIAFAVSAVLGPVLIPFLRSLKLSQTERKEGVQSHLKKAGTPTMGGIIFLIAITVTSLIYLREYPKVLPVLCLTLGFGLIGFLDDYLKVVLRRSDGLLPWQKLIGEFLVTGIFAFYLVHYTDVELTLLVPFSGGYYWDIGILSIPLLFITVLATVNGVNFTDGLDGLSSSVTVLVATFFTVVAVGTESGIHPITCAVVGGLLGFLLFNVYPASVFMGDTGSLALGGALAAMAILTKTELLLILAGGLYVIEALLVIIQVISFKTRGVRVFKMSPIHHHFELSGWSEVKVVTVFWSFSALMAILSIIVVLACK